MNRSLARKQSGDLVSDDSCWIDAHDIANRIRVAVGGSARPRSPLLCGLSNLDGGQGRRGRMHRRLPGLVHGPHRAPATRWQPSFARQQSWGCSKSEALARTRAAAAVAGRTPRGDQTSAILIACPSSASIGLQKAGSSSPAACSPLQCMRTTARRYSVTAEARRSDDRAPRRCVRTQG